MAKKTTVATFASGLVDYEQETDSFPDLREGFEAHMAARAARDPLRLADYAERWARWVFERHDFPLNTSGVWHRLNDGQIMPGSGPRSFRGSFEGFRDSALAKKAGYPFGSLMAWASQLASLAVMLRLAIARGDLADATAGAFEIGQTVQRIFRLADKPADGATVDDAARERIEGKRKRAANAAKGSAARTAGSLAAHQRREAEQIRRNKPRISELALAREVVTRVGGTERAVRRVLSEMKRKNTAPT